MTFFTIITVTYNSERFIRSCLDSVRSQDFLDYEHIVVDGSSSDSTIDIVSDFPNPRLRFFSEPDSGIYDAMNKGILLSRGTFVGFLNSDDFFKTHTILSEMYATLIGTGADICYSDIEYIFSSSPYKISRHWSSQDFERNLLLSGSFPPHPSFYCRLSALKDINGFNQQFALAADFDLMLRLLINKRLMHTYLPVISVAMRLGGATNNSLKNIFIQNFEILVSLFAHLHPLVSIRYYCMRLFRRCFKHFFK